MQHAKKNKIYTEKFNGNPERKKEE